MVDTFTSNFKLRKITLDSQPWHEKEHSNWSIVDAVLARYISIQSIQGAWQNATVIAVGDRYVDTDQDTLWEALIAHTSASTGTFAADRANYTSNWQGITVDQVSLGAWTVGTSYTINSFITDTSRYGVVVSSHIATTSYDTGVADGNIITLIDLSTDVTAAAASATAAAASATAASASATSIAIPAIATDRMIIGNSAGTAWEALSANNIRDVAGLTPTDGGVVIGNGTDFVVETLGTARTSIGTQKIYNVISDYAATGDGFTIDTTEIQAAIDAANTAGGGVVYFPPATYIVSAALQLYKNVSLMGIPGLSLLQASVNHPGPMINAAEDFYTAATPAYWTVMDGIALTAINCTVDIDLFYTAFHFNNNAFRQCAFQGKSTAEAHVGFHWFHSDAGNGANFGYHNLFENCTFDDLYGKACAYFEGTGSGGSRRANNNLFIQCRFSQYKVATWIHGSTNSWENCLFNAPTNNEIVASAGGADDYNFRIVALDGTGNTVISSWFEGATGPNKAVARAGNSRDTATNTDLDAGGIEFLFCNGVVNENQVVDLREREQYAASQTDTDTVILDDTTDHTAEFFAGSTVEVDNGVDGISEAVVDSSSFSTDTTVNLTTAIVTANCIGIRRIDRTVQVDTNTVTVVGDVTAWFPVGSTVWLDQGTGGWHKLTVSGVSYSNPDTTIDFTETTVVATANNIYVTEQYNRSTVLYSRRRYFPNLNIGENITIDQGIGDNQTLTLRSTGDLATGLTTIVEGTTDANTADYLSIEKQGPALGGARFRIMAEDGAIGDVCKFDLYGGTATTAKDSTADGLFHIEVQEHDGANALANVTTDGNIFAVGGRVGAAERTVFIIDIEGSTHADAAAGATYDAMDDAALLRAIDLERGDIVPEVKAGLHLSRFDSNRYDRKVLEDTRLVGKLTPEKRADGVRPLLNTSEEARLSRGAIWQMHEMMDALFDALDPATRTKVRENFVDRGLPTQILDWDGDIPPRR